ncbi:hypothetical protein P7D97_09790 [Enterococcus raffinosus]|nr:hypothetical protein [Enterococcus raffinosus]
MYPFHLLFNGNNPFTLIELVNNIFFTLLIGLLLMIVYKKVDSSFLRYLVVLFFTMVTMFSDWPLVGVLLIFGFYRWKNTKWEIQLYIRHLF